MTKTDLQLSGACSPGSPSPRDGGGEGGTRVVGVSRDI